MTWTSNGTFIKLIKNLRCLLACRQQVFCKCMRNLACMFSQITCTQISSSVYTHVCFCVCMLEQCDALNVNSTTYSLICRLSWEQENDNLQVSEVIDRQILLSLSGQPSQQGPPLQAAPGPVAKAPQILDQLKTFVSLYLTP